MPERRVWRDRHLHRFPAGAPEAKATIFATQADQIGREICVGRAIGLPYRTG